MQGFVDACGVCVSGSKAGQWMGMTGEEHPSSFPTSLGGGVVRMSVNMFARAGTLQC